jgi:hypothetical protein
MPFSGRRRPVFNAMLLAQASFFYYWKRKGVKAELAQTEARRSVLESILQELRSNKPLSDAELARLRRLAAPHPLILGPRRHFEPISMKEAFWGRDKKKIEEDMTDEYLEKVL